MWKSILRKNIRSVSDFASFLELDAEQRHLVDFSPDFPLNIPLRIAGKIEKNNIHDPLCRQFLPLLCEKKHSSFSTDPLQEHSCRIHNHLIKKYEGRALLISTSSCATHCRFCFRRHFPYTPSEEVFQQEIEYLHKHPNCTEVILSGGDPLLMPNTQLKKLFKELSSINHLQRIRIHTRLPIGIPERIDQGLLELLHQQKKQFWIVVHVNHEKELDDDIYAALRKLQLLGIPLLSQTVLLHDVNDSFSSLFNLYTSLINHAIMPYYLHKLDKVLGAEHFDVSEKVGKTLIQQLRNSLPGYGVPNFVVEEPGASSKTILTL